MKLICVDCGNYVHFEAEVEMHQPVRMGSHDLVVEPSDGDGYDHAGRSVRMGIEELVEYCTRGTLETLHPQPPAGQLENRYFSCSRCGSRRVTIPYCPWSPPSPFRTLDDETQHNSQEYQWLRKERLKHETVLPRMP